MKNRFTGKEFTGVRKQIAERIKLDHGHEDIGIKTEGNPARYYSITIGVPSPIPKKNPAVEATVKQLLNEIKANFFGLDVYGGHEEDDFYCQNCGHEGEEVEFEPSDGNPAPHICPECGSTECFFKDPPEGDTNAEQPPDNGKTPPGLKPQHRRALASAVRAFVISEKSGTFTPHAYDSDRWLAWADRLDTGTASEQEWEAARFIMGLPYSQPDYIEDHKSCETLIFALWVVNGTRFGRGFTPWNHPDDYKVQEGIDIVNTLIA